MDIRTQIATHVGQLTLANFEALATVRAYEERIKMLEAENAELKATQSAGAAKAEGHLKEQANGHATTP